MNPSYEMLEFPSIHRKIAVFLQTAPGFFQLERLFPFHNFISLKKRLELVQQSLDYVAEEGNFYLVEMDDVFPYFGILNAEGSALSSEELLEFKKLLAVVVANKTSIEIHKEKYPLLFELLDIREELADISVKINDILDDEGKIRDEASPELRRLRKRKFSLRSEIQSRMNNLIQKELGKEAVPDRIITVRDGRFVIPVKSAFRKKIPAIMHQFSKTGETAYVEPEKIVNLNNEFVEVDDLELKEIRRILRDITADLALFVPDLKSASKVVGLLDLLSALCSFAKQNKCSLPKLTEDSSINLKEAIHPSLALNPQAVPIDISVGKSYSGILISGPNAGGKTVALKTAGLLTLMFLSGIPITANKESEIGFFDHILAEIGDEQNISENLSTFSGHIKSLSVLVKNSTQNSLILIDEIASSTEPTEGQALARAYIESLIEKKVQFVITTHFQSIKTLALEHPEVCNAFVEFDEKNLQPLFKLHIGGAGNSFALKIASKFGLPQAILTRAENLIGEQKTTVEELIDEIDEEKKQLILKEHQLEVERQDLKSLKRELKRKEDVLQKRLDELEQKGIYALRNEIDNSLKDLATLRQQLEQKKLNEKDAEKQIQKVQKVLEQKNLEKISKIRKKASELHPGDRVFVGSLNKSGTVEDVNDKKARVRLGIMSVEVSREDLFEESVPKIKKEVETVQTGVSSFQLILDLRGKRGDEALKELEKNIDRALVQGVMSMEVIHGKGQGILRTLIWDYLKTCPEIKNYFYARPEDGGQGKTIVTFK